MEGLRIGSLCSGYRGLDMAVEEVFGASTAWVSDIDEGANRILAHHWPATPNIGDLTTTDWQSVIDEHGRPHVVCGGYPCQPFSLAGDLKGTEDERHIWPHIARALGVLRPRYAVFENVANHLRLGFDVVLADLARLGFDVEWCLVRADEVGAPHQRRRLIVLASAADAADFGHERSGSTWRGGLDLRTTVSLLPTPRASRGGSSTETMYSLGAERTDETRPQGEVKLFPTPNASFPGTTANFRPDGTPYSEGYGMTLLDAARLLLPTPTAADGDRTSATYSRGNPTLLGAVSPPPSDGGKASSDDPPHEQLTISLD